MTAMPKTVNLVKNLKNNQSFMSVVDAILKSNSNMLQLSDEKLNEANGLVPQVLQLLNKSFQILNMLKDTELQIVEYVLITLIASRMANKGEFHNLGGGQKES